MAYVDQYATARDADFLMKVRVAVLDACVDVMTESTGSAGHAQRAAFAQQVLSYPETHVTHIAEVVAAHTPTLTPTSADQTIKDAVASVWNSLSGYSAN
jgi:hypothetical protein